MTMKQERILNLKKTSKINCKQRDKALLSSLIKYHPSILNMDRLYPNLKKFSRIQNISIFRSRLCNLSPIKSFPNSAKVPLCKQIYKQALNPKMIIMIPNNQSIIYLRVIEMISSINTTKIFGRPVCCKNCFTLIFRRERKLNLRKNKLSQIARMN